VRQDGTGYVEGFHSLATIGLRYVSVVRGHESNCHHNNFVKKDLLSFDLQSINDSKSDKYSRDEYDIPKLTSPLYSESTILD